MKNHIIKKALKELAKAPTTAAEKVLKDLSPEDKKEAARLFAAVGITIKEEDA